jgi:small subunit ribosomal protein S20
MISVRQYVFCGVERRAGTVSRLWREERAFLRSKKSRWDFLRSTKTYCRTENNKMPITKSAKKALRQSQKRRLFNQRRSRTMKSLLKKIREFIAENKKEEALKLLSQVYQALDKAAKGGVIKKNTASRKKSRLSKAIKKIK